MILKNLSSTEVRKLAQASLIKIQAFREKMYDLDFSLEYVYLHQILDFVENDILLREYVHTQLQCQYDILSVVESCMLSNKTYKIPPGDETSFIYQLLAYFRMAYRENRKQLPEALYMYGDWKLVLLNYGTWDMYNNSEIDDILTGKLGKVLQEKLFQDAAEQFNRQVISLFLRNLELYLQNLLVEHKREGKREDQSLTIHISGGTFGDGTIIGGRDFQNWVIKRSGDQTGSDREEFRKLASEIIRQIRAKKDLDPLLIEEVEELIHTVREQAEQDRPKRIIAKMLDEKLKTVQELEPGTPLAGDILDFRERLSRLMEESKGTVKDHEV